MYDCDDLIITFTNALCPNFMPHDFTFEISRVKREQEQGYYTSLNIMVSGTDRKFIKNERCDGNSIKDCFYTWTKNQIDFCDLQENNGSITRDDWKRYEELRNKYRMLLEKIK